MFEQFPQHKKYRFFLFQLGHLNWPSHMHSWKCGEVKLVEDASTLTWIKILESKICIWFFSTICFHLLSTPMAHWVLFFLFLRNIIEFVFFSFWEIWRSQISILIKNIPSEFWIATAHKEGFGFPTVTKKMSLNLDCLIRIWSKLQFIGPL